VLHGHNLCWHVYYRCISVTFVLHANQFIGNAGFFSQVWQQYELSQHLVHSIIEQEAQLSPRDRAMRRVS